MQTARRTRRRPRGVGLRRVRARRTRCASRPMERGCVGGSGQLCRFIEDDRLPDHRGPPHDRRAQLAPAAQPRNLWRQFFSRQNARRRLARGFDLAPLFIQSGPRDVLCAMGAQDRKLLIVPSRKPLSSASARQRSIATSTKSSDKSDARTLTLRCAINFSPQLHPNLLPQSAAHG